MDTSQKKNAQAASLETGPALSSCVLRHITMTSRAIAAAWDRALKPERLTGLQFGLLATLAHSGDLNVNSLARALGMDPSTVPRVIRPLVERRLVSVRTGRDGRERVIRLTASGRAKFERALPCWQAMQQRIVEGYGERRWQSLVTQLHDLRRALQGTEVRKQRPARPRI